MSSTLTQTTQVIRQINVLERQIVAAEDDADAKLWEQARRVVELLKKPGKAGLSERQLASRWINVRTGKTYGRTHVWLTRQVFGQFTGQSPRPRFRDAYNTLANPTKAPKPKSEPESFHSLIATGDLRRTVRMMVDRWPEWARGHAAKLLHDLADDIEKECSDVGRGTRHESANSDFHQVVADHPAIAS
jgi:hypothetical protein